MTHAVVLVRAHVDEDYEVCMGMPLVLWWLHAVTATVTTAGTGTAAVMVVRVSECPVHGDACQAVAMREWSQATSSRERSRAGSRAVSQAWSQTARSRTVFNGSSLLKYNEYNI